MKKGYDNDYFSQIKYLIKKIEGFEAYGLKENFLSNFLLFGSS